ncbi:MAG: hypothetical protein K0R39_3445 [Symbiobacteriaceae bacterium]|jgi:hypothetical protein|nr:hypothetical protein [Symbiobacteriaceae bacterium]
MIRVYLLFRSTHDTLKAESVLAGAGLACRVVQKPSGIRSDCGLAVRVAEAARDGALEALKAAGIEPRGVYSL